MYVFFVTAFVVCIDAFAVLCNMYIDHTKVEFFFNKLISCLHFTPQGKTFTRFLFGYLEMRTERY